MFELEKESDRKLDKIYRVLQNLQVYIYIKFFSYCCLVKWVKLVGWKGED